MLTDDLEELAEGIGYACGIVESHKPVNPEPWRTRCPICDTWFPCDLVSLAALAVLRDVALTASQAREAALQERVRELTAALTNINNTVMRAMTVGLCYEGVCDHPSCDIIRAIRDARKILATSGSQPATDEPWCTEDRHIVLPNGMCECGENRTERLL